MNTLKEGIDERMVGKIRRTDRKGKQRIGGA